MDPNLLNQARSIIGGRGGLNPVPQPTPGNFTPPGFPSPGPGGPYPVGPKTQQTPPSQEYMNSMIKKLGEQIQALWAAGDKTGQADKLNTLREQLVHGDYSNLPPQNTPRPPQPPPGDGRYTPPPTGYQPGPWDNVGGPVPVTPTLPGDRTLQPPKTGYQPGPWDNMVRPAASGRTYTPYARQLQGQMAQNMLPTNNVKYGNQASLLSQFGKR